MKINKNSNLYTILYASALVIVVAALLAGTSIVLKKPQEINKANAKRVNILMSIGKADNLKEAAAVEEAYSTYIADSYCVDVKGNKTQGNAFDTDLKAESAKPMSEKQLPVFEANIDGSKKYILPVFGAGLWGPVWGYVALNDDCKKVFGTVFDHSGETPGLGAEISGHPFQKQFEGKSIVSGNKLTGVRVIKPGSAPLDENSVDGISGGTITSQAVEQMIFKSLSGYESFFEKLRLASVEIQKDSIAPVTDSIQNSVKK